MDNLLSSLQREMEGPCNVYMGVWIGCTTVMKGIQKLALYRYCKIFRGLKHLN
jgi:hypothetical protein